MIKPHPWLNSDRIFGLLALLLALTYLVNATQIESSFLSDPVGSKAFPIAIACVAMLCGVRFLLRPDQSPNWPNKTKFTSICIALAVLIVYALSLRLLAFIIPTFIAAGLLSYQLHAVKKTALLTGCGLSIGLFLIFKYLLGLGLFAFPRTWFG